MQIGDVRVLYDYMFWAHDRTMSTVESLTPEDFVRDLGSSHGSVRGTLVHLMGAEWLYLSRWHGVFPEAMLDPDGFPTVEVLEERWNGIRRELRAFLAQIRDEHLSSVFRYRNLRGEDVSLPLYATLVHVVNHNTYHRGQVVTLLRLLGQKPEATDLYRFFMEEQARDDSGAYEKEFDLVPPSSGPDDEEEPS